MDEWRCLRRTGSVILVLCLSSENWGEPLASNARKTHAHERDSPHRVFSTPGAFAQPLNFNWHLPPKNGLGRNECQYRSANTRRRQERCCQWIPPSQPPRMFMKTDPPSVPNSPLSDLCGTLDDSLRPRAALLPLAVPGYLIQTSRP